MLNSASIGRRRGKEERTQMRKRETIIHHVSGPLKSLSSYAETGVGSGKVSQAEEPERSLQRL